MKHLEKKIGATEFKANCLKILDELGSHGVVITKNSEPIARVTPLRLVDCSKLIGSMKGKVTVRGKLFSTGRKWKAQS